VTTVYTIALIGLLIALHELGHFLVAKLAGVKVLRFSVGFGPRLASRKRGETEYLLSLVPLGGYVQLLNEPPADPEQAECERGRSMTEKSAFWRGLIFAAGPLMNLLLPFLLLPWVYLIGHDVPSYRLAPPVLGHVVADSPAGRAGLQAGDLLLRVNGSEVASWEELGERIAETPDGPLVIQLRRDGQIEWRDVELGGASSADLGLFPVLEALIGEVFPGTPAASAGLQARDRILSVDGHAATSWYVFTSAIETSEGRPLHLEVLRRGEVLKLTVTPTREGERLMVGVAVAQELVRQQHPPLESLQRGTRRGAELIGMTGEFIVALFSGQVDSRQIGGPVAVFRMTGDAVRSSLADTLFMLAFLSIQLGMLNLLPVPVLDGGQLLFLIPEVVLRRPVPQRLREGLQGVGLAMVLCLMALAFYNDLSRLL